ncbi:MAG: response regulator [Reichenbachiella sp.]
MIKEMQSCIGVDDDKLFLKVLEGYISKVEGLSLIETYANPMQGLVAIDKHKPDIIFLDINMPEINGLTILDALDYKPKVIIISSHWEQVDELNKAGAHAFITKPLRDLHAFERIVNKVLALD